MLEIALAGCPSSGKSTFFKAATLKDVKIAPYPFTTTESAEGIAHVTTNCPCKELGKPCGKCIDGIRFVPMKLWDIVGLVPDAHLGKGRGVAFLDDIMQCQGLIHVIDASGKTNLEGNPAQDFDPTLSTKMLDNEFAWWMAGIFKKDQKSIQNEKTFFELVCKRFTGLRIKVDHIKHALHITELDCAHAKDWKDEQIFNFVNELRKISKPTVIAANKFDLPEAKSNLGRLKKLFPDKIIVPTTGDLELALREASKAGLIDYVPGSSRFKTTDQNKITDKQRKALSIISSYLDENKSTGVQEALNRVCFELLKLIVVFPVADPHKLTDKKGNILPDAFLIPQGSTAKDLAFEIHQEIGQKFISAIDAKTGQGISSTQPLKNNDIISIKAGK
jgi:ribosome-binding ATPase YchF (GTP1/OBG family)